MSEAPEPAIATGTEPSRPSRPALRTVIEVGGVAAAYFAAGKLALLLAIPPGYATAVWPAAGIALGSALFLGHRALVGIAIGSFLVNITVNLDASSAEAIARSLAIPGTIAAGAVLQAGVSARLVCCFVNLKLERPRDITRFLVLGGPIGCLVSASCGATTLVLADAIPLSAFPVSWWTWWVGDAIGTIIFAPVVLALLAGPAHSWRGRRLEVVLPLALGFCVVTGFFIYLNTRENRQVEAELETRARVIATALERRLDRSGELVRSVVNLYNVKRDVSQSDFRTFVSGSIERQPLDKIAWAPRVIQPDDHVAISFIEPLEGNEALIGLELGSDATFAASVRRARDEGIVVATHVIAPQQPRGLRGVFVLAPVFDDRAPHATVAERRSALRGVVMGVLPASLLTTVIADLDHRGMNIRVLAGETVLFGNHEGAGSTGARWSTSLDVPGANWTLECTAADPFARRWQAWTVLAGGLLFVGMLGGVQLLVTGRAAQVIESQGHKTRLLSELQASEERLRLAQEVAHIGTFEWDIQTHLNTWTPELEVMHGLPVGGFGRTLEAWQNLMHPDDRAEAMKRIAKSFDAPATTEAEWRVVWPDGSTHWLAARWQILKDASGAPLRMAGITMDITDRKRAEAERERLLAEIRQLGKDLESRVAERTRELATARSRLEGIIEIAADAIISTDEQQRITIFNQGAEEIFGWSQDEVLGRDLDVLLPERIRATHRKHLANFAVEPGVARRMAERRPVFGRRKNGEEFPAEAAISKLQTPTELLFTVILRDISARQRLEAERSRIFDERGVLLKEIHHRVKNNLQVISSLFALQGRRTSHEAFRSLLDESRNRIHSIALVHDQLYRASNLAEIDFDEYLREEILGIQATYGPLTGDVTVEIDAKGIVLNIDHAVPCGLLVNELVSNAFKHAFKGRSGGKVRIAVHETETELVLQVSDNGVGIPAGFDWHATPTLGLQLVQSLAAQLRGSVELDTAHGTCFTVRFVNARKPQEEEIA